MTARNETSSNRRPNITGLPGLIGKKALLRATSTKDSASGVWISKNSKTKKKNNKILKDK